MRPRTAAALRENAGVAAHFKQIATLVPIDASTRPPDRATDFAGGARAAKSWG